LDPGDGRVNWKEKRVERIERKTPEIKQKISLKTCCRRGKKRNPVNRGLHTGKEQDGGGTWAGGRGWCRVKRQLIRGTLGLQ